jgi:hypothetical protein
MRTCDGPFPVETTHLWADTAWGGTRMTLRNRVSRRGSAALPRR